MSSKTIDLKKLYAGLTRDSGNDIIGISVGDGQMVFTSDDVILTTDGKTNIGIFKLFNELKEVLTQQVKLNTQLQDRVKALEEAYIEEKLVGNDKI